ncbi:MAG: exbB, partial [Tardiphaga sp.]|nr:exbB [Tardiphaga sp.]
MFRTTLKLLSVLAVFALASPLAAQQAAAPPAPVVTQQPVAPTVAIDPSGAEAPKSAKAAVAVGGHELSPWTMFKNADIIVQAVMLGLAFASLVTWTVAIAKTMELSASQRRLKHALKRISESRSLSEAQLALGKKETVLSSLLAAAMKEGRMAAGIATDGGIKERA